MSKNYNYITPAQLQRDLAKEFPLSSVDVCPIDGTEKLWFDNNGLLMEWPNYSFVNPPYSNVRPWIVKVGEGLARCLC